MNDTKTMARKLGGLLLQQVAIFATGMAFLRAARWLTGHTLHGLQDRIGLVEAVGVLLVYGAHLALSVWIFRRAGGRGSLGIALSPRRALEFAVAAPISFALYGAPWFLALASGAARVTDHLSAHPIEPLQIAYSVVAGLIVNSVVEEVTSRAFPIRLFSEYGVWLRILLPSVLFAALHLVDEPFRAGPFAARTMAGVTLSIAYVTTGNIWLAAGIHSGINLASLWGEGLWHAGSVVKLEGQPIVPTLYVEIGIGLAAVVGYALWSRPASRRATTCTGRSFFKRSVG